MKSKKISISECNSKLKAAGFSKNQLQQTFSTFQRANPGRKQLLEFCKNYKLSNCFLFISSQQIAVTDHLLSATIHELVYHEKIKKFWAGSFPAFLREYRSISQGKNSNEVAAFVWATKFDLLCFRNISLTDLSTFEKNLLIDVLDYYYENEKPIFMSTPVCEKSDYLESRILNHFTEKLIPFEEKSLKIYKTQSTKFVD